MKLTYDEYKIQRQEAYNKMIRKYGKIARYYKITQLTRIED